jgi:predicted dehydrogenase
MLRVALVGCGQIADAHLEQIRKIECAELVAVCDRETDLARQAAARFHVPLVCEDLGTMIQRAQPDVLHVTTPPHTHHAIALEAIKEGLHLYIEKPFAVDAAETQQILAAAAASGRLVCVGHDQLFDPVWQECRQLYERGSLGRVIHVDSVLGYDLTGPFGKSFSTDPTHWLHRLPGGLFQNTISHALYRITEFLEDERPRVWSTWFSGQPDARVPTELRVFLQGKDVTANLLFSSAARPIQRVVHIYGSRRSIEVDLDGRVIRARRQPALRGAFIKIETPARQLGEAAIRTMRNLWAFARNDLHYFEGMNRLFRAFYHAVETGGDPPILPHEILRVTAIMDEIFIRCLDDSKMPPGSSMCNGSGSASSRTLAKEPSAGAGGIECELL